MLQQMALLAALTIASAAMAQKAEQDGEKPTSDFSMTEAEMRQRMKELNKKAAGRPVDKAAEAEDLRQRQLGRAKLKLTEAELAAENYKRAQEQLAANAQALAQIESEIAAIKRAGQQAENNFRRLLQVYEVDSLIAASAGRSFFRADVVDQFGRDIGMIEGELENPAAAIAAVQAVEARYGAELRESRAEVAELFGQYVNLLKQRVRITKDQEQLARVRTTAGIRELKARKAARGASGAAEKHAGAEAPVVKAEEGKVAAENEEAFLREVQKDYSFNVRPIWNESLAEAREFVSRDQ